MERLASSTLLNCISNACHNPGLSIIDTAKDEQRLDDPPGKDLSCENLVESAQPGIGIEPSADVGRAVLPKLDLKEGRIDLERAHGRHERHFG